MSKPSQNIELKARCKSLAKAEEICLEMNAMDGGVERQVDTFFHARRGRLKMREINEETAALIWYDRPDETQTRQSNYYLVPVSAPATLQASLEAALGIIHTVVKRRRIYHYGKVRIHLDQVEGLGTFVEFEAVLSPDDDASDAHALLAALRDRFGITDDDLVAVPYACLSGQGDAGDE